MVLILLNKILEDLFVMSFLNILNIFSKLHVVLILIFFMYFLSILAKCGIDSKLLYLFDF